MTTPMAEVVVDLDAIRHNVHRLGQIAHRSAVMVVVKADGYGHGLVAAARAARDADAGWLGVATIDEALALRAAGDTEGILCWLAVPGADYHSALQANVDVTASSVVQLTEIAATSRWLRRPASVHLKVDTGLSRNGSPPDEWPRLVEHAEELEARAQVQVEGIWSHLACADEPDHPANEAQERAFDRALAVVRASELEPMVTHLANSPATLTRPSAHRDVVRVGLAAYGLSPVPAIGGPAHFGLRPALSLRARLAAVRKVPAGTGVSYGHTHVTDAPTTLGLVPVGYGEGIAVTASNRGRVTVAGRSCPQVGRVCMDQLVVDLGAGGADGARPGDEVVLIGADEGEPTAQEWAEAGGTISYEVVTRLGGRLTRTYLGAGG